MVNSLQMEIIKTLVYFDGLSRPLSLLEIKKWLGDKASILEIRQALLSEFLSTRVDRRFGLYFIRGREELIETRWQRYRLAHHKFKKAKRMARIFSILPWILGVAVYSSLSFYNSNASGDIDLFLVTRKGRVWSARFFINLFLKIFNLRPNVKTSQDKICVSFLVDESNLDLSSLVSSHQRRHYIYGTGQFIFLYSHKNTAKRFFTVNYWLEEKLPNWFGYDVNRRHKVVSKMLSLKWLIELLVGFIPERVYKKFQLWIMPAKLKVVKDAIPSVVISSVMIKLHDNEVGRRDDEVFYNNLKKCIS